MCAAAEAKTALDAALGDNASLVSEEVRRERERKKEVSIRWGRIEKKKQLGDWNGTKKRLSTVVSAPFLPFLARSKVSTEPLLACYDEIQLKKKRGINAKRKRALFFLFFRATKATASTIAHLRKR